MVLTYVDVSSLMLSLENIYGTRPCWWDIQCGMNSLVLGVWMVFSWLWFFTKVTPLFFLECVYLCLLYPSFAFDIWFVVSFCVCVYVCVCVCARARVGVVSDFTHSNFSSVCVCVWVWMCVLRFFLCLVRNILVIIFTYNFCVYIYIYIYIYTDMKLRLVYCRRRWQAFSLEPFTHAYRPDSAERIAGIRSDNILFRDVIQSQANTENYDTEIFEQAGNEDNTKCTI